MKNDSKKIQTIVYITLLQDLFIFVGQKKFKLRIFSKNHFMFVLRVPILEQQLHTNKNHITLKILMSIVICAFAMHIYYLFSLLLHMHMSEVQSANDPFYLNLKA